MSLLPIIYSVAVPYLGPFESCEFSIMVNGNCGVVGCESSQYRVNKWKKVLRAEHLGMLQEECLCEQPYTMHCFSSTLQMLHYEMSEFDL